MEIRACGGLSVQDQPLEALLSCEDEKSASTG